ncbi:MAG: hypothetical protein KGL35_07005 [Bradyrhizobium sp.]|nr:hypothetical protein [Bradyrhizobium sp.]
MKTLADLTAPAEITRTVLEKDLQKQCAEWARARGYWARKFSSMSQRSVPDYLFSVGGRRSSPLKFACEFKKPGTKPKLIERYGVVVMSTEAQYEEQLAMREAGWFVFECDDFEMFKKMVLTYERENV